jgi:hypothetical protein
MRLSSLSLIFALTVVLTTSARCQDSAHLDLEIEIPHGTLKSDLKHYSFPIRLQAIGSDRRQGELNVHCSNGLVCTPLAQNVSFSNPNLTPLAVDIQETLNSAEIDLNLSTSDGKLLLVTSGTLNFGLWDSVESIGSDFSTELMGGAPSGGRLWLEDLSGGKLRPTSIVQLEIIPRNGCARVKSVNTGPDAKAVNFGPYATVKIDAWHNVTSDELWVEPNVWNNSVCLLDVNVMSGRNQMASTSLKLSIKPNYLAAFLFCLFGAFVQYVLAGLVQLVLATRADQKVSFRKIFVGSNFVEIIEALLKGSIAYLLAYILNTTDIVQFRGANRGSLLGFAIFGFLIGFWQLKPLWEAIRRLSDSAGPPATAIPPAAPPAADP